MSAHLVPILFVLGAWWVSTCLVLKMVWLGPSTVRLRVATASVLAVLGLYGIRASSLVATNSAAYVAFVCALLVWAWHELTFLLGIVTGPRKTSCPPDARGFRRFRYATAVVIHHELALALTLLFVVAVTWGRPNQVGTWTYAVLWGMRLSAKLNVFLGVRNISEQFVPDHLRYMVSYFRRARMNPLMPLSLLAASLVTIWIVGHTAPGDPVAASIFGTVARTLVATILGLAVLEHLFLSLPVPDALLWRWAIRNEQRQATESPRNLRPEPR